MVTVISIDGRTLNLGWAVRTVVTLKSGVSRGLSLERVLHADGEHRAADAALRRVSEYDREQIDRWILSSGLGALEDLDGKARGSVLFAPVGFSTLANPRSRREVLAEFTQVQARLGVRVAIELTALDVGLPPSRLVEVLTMLKPAFRVVFARLRPEPRAVKAVIGCGLSGVALDATDIADPEDGEAMTRIRLAMEAVGPRLIVHNLHTVAALNVARTAGVTYATLEASRLQESTKARPAIAARGAATTDRI